MADTLSPLQAAARAITAKDKWGEDAIGCGARNSDCRSGACLDCSRLIARAALLAAVQVLPETFLSRINLRTEEWAAILESDPTLEQERAHRQNVRKSLLAQALGVNG